jgi:AraC-like DNA-binding protein
MGRSVGKAARVEVEVWSATGVRVERYAYSPGHDPGIAAHAHEEVQLCYSACSGGTIRIGRRWQVAQPGHLYCFPPRAEHTCARETVVERDSTYEVVYLRPPDADWGLGGRPSTAAFDGSSIGGWLSGAVTAPAVMGNLQRLMAAVRRRRIDSALVDDAAFALLSGLRPGAGAGRVNAPLAERVRQVLHAAPSCPTLADLARTTGEPAAAVRAAFRLAFGMPPARYHLLRRLQQARGQLLAGLAADAVARRCGFVDQAHLSRRMKRYFGHAPGGLHAGS